MSTQHIAMQTHHNTEKRK